MGADSFREAHERRNEEERRELERNVSKLVSGQHRVQLLLVVLTMLVVGLYVGGYLLAKWNGDIAIEQTMLRDTVRDLQYQRPGS